MKKQTNRKKHFAKNRQEYACHLNTLCNIHVIVAQELPADQGGEVGSGAKLYSLVKLYW